MAITLKRQLNDGEKNIILKRFGRKCYATDHEIPQEDPVHFDHIRAFAKEGPSELNNIAPMCEHHNKAKGTLSLEDFRIKLKLEEFFQEGNRLTLKNLLLYLKEKNLISVFGESVSYTIKASRIVIESSFHNSEYEIHTCPLTKWKYFYGLLPISILDSDDEDKEGIGLQPRYLIFDKVFKMFRHFQAYPVLQPSIGRITKNKILLFDGQHKAAALLWNDRKELECKIYIEPECRILNETNISAHDEFAQTRFFSPIMIQKLGRQFGKDFEIYKNDEEQQIKSEANFLVYLHKQNITMSKGGINKRFRDYLYYSILEDIDDKLKNLISESNRSSNEQPLTIDMLSKSIFACFLYKEPVNDNMSSDAYKREIEFNNNVKLLNLIFKLALSSWNPKQLSNDTTQLKLRRIFSSKSIMAWCEIFCDALLAKLEIKDQEERERPFYRELEENDFVKIESLLEKLISWSVWSAPEGHEIDTYIASNKSTLKEWFKSKGLTTGYLMGASE